MSRRLPSVPVQARGLKPPGSRGSAGHRLLAAFIVIALFAAGCGPTTIVERVPQTVIVTPKVPEVTRQVTVEVTVPVTVVVTRVVRATVIVTATSIPPPSAALGDAAASQAALRWLVGQQRLDGGFGGVRDTAWTVIALAAAGVNPEDVVNEAERNPLGYLEGAVAGDLIVGPELTALAALAFAEAGRETPEALGLAELPTPAAWPALPLLVMARGGAPDAVLRALIGAQAEDGGFGGVTNTAWAILALADADEEAPLADAASYLRAHQLTGGAWSATDAGAPDALATALALWALVETGQDLGAWGDPLHALLGLQQDDGSFGDTLTTAAAVVAIQKARELGK